MALLGIPSLPKGAAIETQDVMLRGEEGIEEVVIRELRFRWVRDRSVMVDHINSGVASMQDGGTVRRITSVLSSVFLA